MRKPLLGLLASLLTLSACAHGVTHHPGFITAKARAHGHLAPRLLVANADNTGHVYALHYRHGKLIEQRDLGYGTVTNFGVQAMANDGFWAAPSGAAINTLVLEKYMGTGTGTTASASTDVTLQTADAMTVATGVITNVSTANTAKEQIVGTINYTGTEAVTEWGLFNNATESATTGTPWTAGAATTGTVTGTPYTASSTTVQGEEEFVFSDTTKSPAICGLATANTSSVVTVTAWYKCTDNTASGTNPANADALKIYPVMLDHMVFAAINVINGDSIQFTFTLSLPSGS